MPSPSFAVRASSTPRDSLARLSLMFFACALDCALGCARSPVAPPPSAPSVVLGNAMPAFRRPTVQGGTFDTSGATGRVLVVDFFAAYCRPCQRSLPAVENLHRARPDVAFLGISLDADAEIAVRQVDRHRLTFPVIHDAGSVLAGRFRVTELPATFVMDGTGRIIWVAGSQPRDGDLESVVAAATRGR